MLTVDDSILEKAYTDPSAQTFTHWNYRQGRFVKGLNLGSLRYQAGALALLITVELIEKTETAWDARAQEAKAENKYTKNACQGTMPRVAQ